MIRRYKDRLAPRPLDKRVGAGARPETGGGSDGKGCGKTSGLKTPGSGLETFTAPPHQRAIT